MPRAAQAPIRRVSAKAFRVPTDAHESDGTFEWDATTLVLARVEAEDACGIGWSYTDASAATLVDGLLAPVLVGSDAFAIGALWAGMAGALRNVGCCGVGAMALSALDIALWDLNGRMLGLPVARLLGGLRRDAIAVYGSGGFTSYDDAQLRSQLSGWADEGFGRVKMKVGRDAADDCRRVRLARRAIGDGVSLFVDANGGYTRKQALQLAQAYADEGVRWFEEPVSSEDVEGLRLMRDRMPAPIDVAAGEYGWSLADFRRLLEAGAVDVLQADATRCGGLTGFMRAAALCVAHGLPLSSHCAPALHAAACCCAPGAVHMEWFHDHVRIERMFFDGMPQPRAGRVSPSSAPGLGLEFRAADAEAYAV
jgi:L-alanine-DL-glutamate epimerase-like enolase superfamily enzyme